MERLKSKSMNWVPRLYSWLLPDMWPGAVSTEILLFAMWGDSTLWSMDPLLDTNCDLLSSTPDISSSSLSFIQRNYLECLLFPVWSRTWSSLKVWISSKFKLARLSSILFVATCSDGWLNHGLFPRGYLIQHPHYRWSGPSSRSHSYTLSYSFSQTCHLVLCSQHVHRKLLDEQKTRPTLRMEQLLAAQMRS